MCTCRSCGGGSVSRPSSTARSSGICRGRVSIFDLQGNVITRWGGADREAPGYFVAPHTLCLDSRGDMYVGEVTWTFGVSRGGVREDAHTFQKFARL